MDHRSGSPYRSPKEDGWRRLSPDVAHFLFGYYDRNPWDPSVRRHLALRVPQCSRLPKVGETAEVGYLERRTGQFVACAETRAFCHQQGSMQQWLDGNRFIYNDFESSAGRLVSRVFELGAGIVRTYDRPIYTVSPNRALAVSLNFSRIPRRGYSYADAPLSDARHPNLDTDGLFVLDLASGESTLVASYRQIVTRYPMPYELEERYWWLNHAQFNVSSTRLQFLFRHADTPDGRWSTTMYTVGADGSQLRCVLPNQYWSGKISHQLWGRTAAELLVDANWRDRGHEYVVLNDAPDFRAHLVSEGLGPMGHLVFSPDGRYLLADTYPKEGVQTLALVDAASGSVEVIGTFAHSRDDGGIADTRCDLHPKWSGDGSLISVDSIDSGHRGIYVRVFEPA